MRLFSIETLIIVQIFRGVLVSQVWMNKVHAVAYKKAFSAIFSQVQSDHPIFSVGKTLNGIVLDWSDTQLKGLEMAIGKEVANKTIKGCQVRVKRIVAVSIHNLPILINVHRCTTCIRSIK